MKGKSKILRLIKRLPGIHFREVMRVLNLSRGTVGRALIALEEEDKIKHLIDGNFKFYYPIDTENMTAISPAQKKILKIINQRGECNITDLSRALNCTKPNLQYHVKKLLKKGKIERRLEKNAFIYSCNRGEK